MTLTSKLLVIVLCILILLSLAITSPSLLTRTITVTSTITSIKEQYVTSYITKTKTITSTIIKTTTITKTITETKIPFNVKYFRPFTSKLVLSFMSNSLEIGKLMGWFNITRYDDKPVRAILWLSLPTTKYIKNVSLLIELSLIPYDGAYPPPPMLKVITLSNGSQVVIMDKVYDMSKYMIPGFFIGYSIQAIRLTLKNNQTILYFHFYKGSCKVRKNMTITQIREIMGGIHPLWEKKYKYPPTIVYKELRELSGVYMKTTVRINVNNGTYKVKTSELITRP